MDYIGVQTCALSIAKWIIAQPLYTCYYKYQKSNVKTRACHSRTHQHAFSASPISVLLWPQYGAVCRILAFAIEFGPCLTDLVVVPSTELLYCGHGQPHSDRPPHIYRVASCSTASDSHVVICGNNRRFGPYTLSTHSAVPLVDVNDYKSEILFTQLLVGKYLGE